MTRYVGFYIFGDRKLIHDVKRSKLMLPIIYVIICNQACNTRKVLTHIKLDVFPNVDVVFYTITDIHHL